MNWPNYDSEEPYRSAEAEPSRAQKPARGQADKDDERCFVVEKELYTSGQAARLLGVPPRTLRRYLSIGKIQGNQNPITQTWHITCDALIEFIEAQGGRAILKQGEVNAIVIDDKRIVARLLNRLAEKSHTNIVVREFQEVGDALIESGVHRPDLIVINTTSPYFDGIGLLRLLRSNPHTQSSKILAIADGKDTAARMRSYGASMTLLEPFGYGDLAEKLSTLFPLLVQLPS
jgi:CheY-like chemotaxis protein